MSTAAKLLTGKDLNDGWIVVEEIIRDKKKDTGGLFSVSYIIENKQGRRAFLKAVDFSSALSAEDPAKMLEEVTKAFNFERQLLRRAAENRMDRVVTPIGDGTINVPEAEGPPVTQYLIFELADGDLRRQIDVTRRYETAWRLRALHHIAVGMNQLHKAGIAHQDLKPSNVLVYRFGGSKVADLGRATAEDLEAPHDSCIIAGDRTYAPLELLYGHVPADRASRRFGCDAYLMGSMVCFMFTGLPFTPLLLRLLRDEHLPPRWGGTYEGVLPYLRDAFGFAIDHFSECVDESYRGELSKAVKELCDPDPLLRGHPLTRRYKGNAYGLERYISLFNFLARSAEGRRH